MSDELPTAAAIGSRHPRPLPPGESLAGLARCRGALAHAQAELGIIPAPAAEAIARAARLEFSTAPASTRASPAPGTRSCLLVWELSRVVGEPHGGWVHWGATTQNITQTGDLLVLRQAHQVFLRLIGEALSAMADLAELGADMPIAGRTHGQHALPRDLRLQARSVDRRDDPPCRAVSAGRTSHFCRDAGRGCRNLRVARRTGAVGAGRHRARARHAINDGAGAHVGDHLAENICLLGMLAATCGKIGREIYTLMKTEFGEVEEPVPPGTVGSSTMPQKRNPKLCQDIIAAAAEVRSAVPLALEAMQTEHEADRTTSLIMDAAERAPQSPPATC